MKRDDIPLAVLDGRHAGAQLAHPCRCTNPRCHNLGDHLWDSTRDMTPGIRAQAFEPRTITPSTGDDNDPPADPTGTTHDTYRALLDAYRNSARDLTRFIDRHRPDRHRPALEVTATDDQWCTHHLDLIGTCEPRYRGDLCRGCYDFQLANSTPPDAQLLRAIRDRGRITPGMLADWRARTRTTRKPRRKKAG